MQVDSLSAEPQGKLINKGRDKHLALDPSGTIGKEYTYQYRRHKKHVFDPWVGKILWRRAWQPTLALLPGESHGQRSLVGYSPWRHKESDTTGWLMGYFHSGRVVYRFKASGRFF